MNWYSERGSRGSKSRKNRAVATYINQGTQKSPGRRMRSNLQNPERSYDHLQNAISGVAGQGQEEGSISLFPTKKKGDLYFTNETMGMRSVRKGIHEKDLIFIQNGEGPSLGEGVFLSKNGI